jgi:hypothetical protein
MSVPVLGLSSLTRRPAHSEPVEESHPSNIMPKGVWGVFYSGLGGCIMGSGILLAAYLNSEGT